MALHIKKGDMVEIIAGDHKGSKGKVLRVIPEKNRVVIQGHNLVKKHVRPSRQNPQGGRISVEKPIHMSNVLVVGSSDKGVRTRFEVGSDGAKKRKTIDGKEVSVVKKSKS